MSKKPTSPLRDDKADFRTVHAGAEIGAVSWAPVYSSGVLHGALWTNGHRMGWRSVVTDDKALQAAVAASQSIWLDRLSLAAAATGPSDPAGLLSYWHDQAYPGGMEVGEPRPAQGIDAVQAALG